MSTDQIAQSRRRFLVGATSTLLCAPAVVRAASLMPVRGLIMSIKSTEPDLIVRPQEGFVRRLLFAQCESNLKAGRTDSSFNFNNGRLSEQQMRELVAYARKWQFLE